MEAQGRVVLFERDFGELISRAIVARSNPKNNRADYNPKIRLETYTTKIDGDYLEDF